MTQRPIDGDDGMIQALMVLPLVVLVVLALVFGLAPFFYYLKMWWQWWGLTL